MKRKLLLLSVTLLLTISGIAYAAGVNGAYKGKNIVKVTYEGREVTPDKVPGYMDGANTMVPLGMLRSMGVTVEWDQKKLTANVKLPPPRTVPVLIQSQLDELSKYVYEVQAPLPDDAAKARQGSGFLVNGTFITNAHVIGDSTSAQVLIDGTWQKVSSFSFVNKDVDLAGMKVTGGESPPTSTVLPQVGDPVYAIGYPHGELKITEGFVREIKEFNWGTDIIHSALVESGGSGSALFNGRGEVIGVNKTSIIISGENHSYATPIKYLEKELNK